jgi:hypothetical protein
MPMNYEPAIPPVLRHVHSHLASALSLSASRAPHADLPCLCPERLYCLLEESGMCNIRSPSRKIVIVTAVRVIVAQCAPERLCLRIFRSSFISCADYLRVSALSTKSCNITIHALQVLVAEHVVVGTHAGRASRASPLRRIFGPVSANCLRLPALASGLFVPSRHATMIFAERPTIHLSLFIF